MQALCSIRQEFKVLFSVVWKGWGVQSKSCSGLIGERGGGEGETRGVAKWRMR